MEVSPIISGRPLYPPGTWVLIWGNCWDEQAGHIYRGYIIGQIKLCNPADRTYGIVSNDGGWPISYETRRKIKEERIIAAWEEAPEQCPLVDLS